MGQPTQTTPTVTDFTLLDWLVLEEAVDRDLGLLLPLVVNGIPTPANARAAVQDLLSRVRMAISTSPRPRPGPMHDLFPIALGANDLKVVGGLHQLFGVAAGVAKDPMARRSFTTSARTAYDLQLRMVFGSRKPTTPAAS